MSLAALREELAQKRRAAEEARGNEGNQKRFATRKEIEATQQNKSSADSIIEKERKSLAEELVKLRKHVSARVENASGESRRPYLPVLETMRRLRMRNQPITLFGEDEFTRAERLRLLEERHPMEYEEGTESEFMLRMRQMDTQEVEGEEEVEEKKKKAKEKEEVLPDLSKEHTKEDAIFVYLKNIMKAWDESLVMRPEDEKRTAQGRVQSATFMVCQKDMGPLFTYLKQRTLKDEILDGLDSIVKNLQQREYVKAHDSYLSLAIGKAAWPMGVTMVGIHERSAREKIFNQHTAHILNDETTRKYLQAIKRIMTFVQAAFPTDPSKCVR